MKIKKEKTLKSTNGITLIALVVTIIVLLILAGITISLALSNNGIIQRARDASDTYQKAEQNELQQLSEFADSIDELTGKTELSEDKIAAIINNIKTSETLQEVEYEAKKITDDETSVAGKGRSVTVEGAYSGTGSDQTFYQSEIGAIGPNKLKWYVLSADEKGVNLVSEVTKKSVNFQDSPGYDNCLYYLNELSTKLFANEDYGIAENRIHALNLTDIKKAAEQANAGYKVTDNGTERDWSWDLDVVKASDSDVYNKGNIGQKTYTPSNKYYPGIYTANSNKEVIANNPMYDEEPGSKITTDSGIKRTLDDGSNPANSLAANNTYFTTENNTRTLARMGKFGRTNIGKQIFNESGENYWIASRCVYSYAGSAGFYMNCVKLGHLYYGGLCYATGYAGESSNPFRVVISVPAKNINVADDGTVTLKSK